MPQVRKAKKLLPWDQKLFDTAPQRTKKMDNARNVPRKGGFGGGGAYQKISKNIPSKLPCSSRRTLLRKCSPRCTGTNDLTPFLLK